MLRDRSVRYNPPQFELLTQAVGCVLPADSHLDVYDVHTLYALLDGMALYPRFRVCLPAEYNSLRGRASLGCVRMLLPA